MANLLENKVALVAGGSSGIGRGAALALGAAGAKVVVAARRVEEGEAVAEAIRSAGGEATFIKADVTVAPEVEALVAKTVERYGRLDCAFNNAGISGRFMPLADYSEEQLDEILKINVKGMWYCMKYEIPQMLAQGAGSIVNMSSILGLSGSSMAGLYSLTKHAVLGMTRCAALDYARLGIRVNALCPIMIDETPIAMFARQTASEGTAAHIASIPMGRMGKVEEVGSAVVWLCSDASSFVTGHGLPIDGGVDAS